MVFGRRRAGKACCLGSAAVEAGCEAGDTADVHAGENLRRQAAATVP